VEESVITDMDTKQRIMDNYGIPYCFFAGNRVYLGREEGGADMNQYVNVTVPVPEGVLLSLRVEGDEFAAQMKALTALKLCEQRKLSIGQSAVFAGMDEASFIKFLGQNNVSIFGSASEIKEDYCNA
jgi:hypothetical protein